MRISKNFSNRLVRASKQAVAVFCLCALASSLKGVETYLSPTAMTPSPDKKNLYIACATAQQVLEFDLASRKVGRALALEAAPSGMVLSKDGKSLYVTAGSVDGIVAVIDLATGKTVKTFHAGHTPMGPVLSPDGATLYVCNRFSDDVSFIDTASGKELKRVKVQREPVAAAVTQDGKHLLVANFLHKGAADADFVAAVVSVVNVADGKVAKELTLPNGSGALNDIQVTPDGKYACVTHILARFHLPTTQLDRGWMNTNAKTIIDLARMEILNTVLLDNVDSGAANPWGIAWSADSKTVAVAHAGTHEISIIDFPALLAKLAQLPKVLDESKAYDYTAASRIQSDVPNDLSFLVGVRQRVRFSEADRGPRAVAIVDKQVIAANYFSGTLSIVDMSSAYLRAESVSLGAQPAMSKVRKGEMSFHDATICFQGWQSCASCHPGDARVDALNWDLLNDGIGNPKNNKSMLLSHRTPPAMSMGVRDTAETAVRSGIKHILFTVQPDEVASNMDEYLKALKPVPSPLLVKGELSAQAKKGEAIFNDSKVGCASCHPKGLFTDKGQYKVGTRGRFDRNDDPYDTPTLIEVWRTAPYLHDGSAATMREVLTTKNPKGEHGKTSHLSAEDIDALAAYVLSL